MLASSWPAERGRLRAAGDLLAAVRHACSAQSWARGGNLSRGGRVTVRPAGQDEIAVRIITRGGALTPEVTLAPGRAHWSCACPSEEQTCAHVAGVVMLLSHAADAQEGIPRRALRLAYALERLDGNLGLVVSLVRGTSHERVTISARALAARLQPERLSITPLDEKVSELLRERRVGPILRPVMEPLLAVLRDVEDLRLDDQPICIGDPSEVLTVRLETASAGHFRLRAHRVLDTTELFDNGAALRGDMLLPIRDLDLSPNDQTALEAGRIFAPAEVHTLVTEVLPALRERVPVDVRTRGLPSLVEMAPRIAFEVVRDGGVVVVTAEMVYGDPPCAQLEGGRLTHLGGPLPSRDRAAERALSARLRAELGMQCGRASSVAGEEAVALAAAVREFGAEVDGAALDACFVGAPLELDLLLAGDRAELAFTSEHEGAPIRATVDAVLAAWRGKSRLVALEPGGWAPLPEGFLERHGHLVADLLLASEGRAALPMSAGADVARLAEVLGRPAPPDFTRLRALAEGFAELPAAGLPADFCGELRGYQRDGVDWLAFLSAAGLGALLADDMGLGKTVQAICVLGSPSLVVCPASVLHAWLEEIARFRPEMKVQRYHRADRSLDGDADVVVTTYAILRRDIELLSQREWDTVVLDEAQQIKNPSSRVAQAAYQLKARFRLVLTGTPIENRLEDLWSQMHFLNPGLLGGIDDFRERYARPVNDGDAEAADRLRIRVRPFVTRRLKSKVASELPPRTDVVLHCTLDDEERAAYDAVRAATREEVVRELAAGRGVLDALEALLRLRQAACHTGLLPGRSAPSSSKIRLLMETLEEALAEGHRVLIFSQWTSMLDLVEPHLASLGIQFVRLDGGTRDRAGVVGAFQAEDGPPVMLISLKAGGTGLTLTRADHVFLVDPWWNPAVEDQAADRIHRIGQKHPVLVHRLVAEDTVEEQLLALQVRKRALSSTILDNTEGGARPAGLTRDDLLSLLS